MYLAFETQNKHLHNNDSLKKTGHFIESIIKILNEDHGFIFLQKIQNQTQEYNQHLKM